MINKLIWILIIVATLFVGWKLLEYWGEIQQQRDSEARHAPVQITSGDQLGGLTPQLETSLHAAEKSGAPGLRNWLKQYALNVQDPRKAWIQLDYVVQVSRDDPKEAKRMFETVKSRTPTNSPIYFRIRQLEKTYE